ncbi:MAG: hypothetical protein ACYC2H_01110 [Thermoplasmatota archaeon]
MSTRGLFDPPRRSHARYWSQYCPLINAMDPEARSILESFLQPTNHGRHILYLLVQAPVVHQTPTATWLRIVASGQGKRPVVVRNAFAKTTLPKPWRVKPPKPVSEAALYNLANRLIPYLIFVGPRPLHIVRSANEPPLLPGQRDGAADDLHLRAYLDLRRDMLNASFVLAPEFRALAGLDGLEAEGRNETTRVVHRFYLDTYGPEVAKLRAPWNMETTQRVTTFTRWMSWPHVNTFLESIADLPWRVFLRLVAAGLDPDIALALQRDDVAFSRNNFLLVRLGDGWVAVMADPTDASDLKGLMLDAEDNGPLFPAALNIQQRSIAHRITDLGAAAKVPRVTLRRLLLHGAAELLVHGANEYYVQRVSSLAYADVLNLRDDARKAYRADSTMFRSKGDIARQATQQAHRCPGCGHIGVVLRKDSCPRCGSRRSPAGGLDHDTMVADLQHLHRTYLAAMATTPEEEARRLREFLHANRRRTSNDPS